MTNSGALSASADYIQDYQTYSAWRVQGSQWTIENNQILSYNFSGQNTTSNDYIMDSLTFQGTDANNNQLEFAIIERQYGSWNSSVLETSYYPVNTNINLTGLFRPNEHYAYTIYVRRADGGVLAPSDMERSLIVLYINGQQTVKQTTALPESWFNTTVPTISTPIDTVTTVRTDIVIDESGVANSLEYPPVIESALVQLMSIMSTVLTLKYIRFLLGFAIITGLIAWFLH